MSVEITQWLFVVECLHGRIIKYSIYSNIIYIQITYVEQPLKDPTRALGTYGVKDGDVVVLRQADRRPPPTQPAFPGNA